MKKSRREFLQIAGLTGLGIAGAGLTGMSKSLASSSSLSFEQEAMEPLLNHEHFNMSGYRAPKLENVRVGLIGLRRGRAHLQHLIKFEGVEIKAICDLLPENIRNSQKLLEKASQTPTVYTGGDEEWKKMCERDDIDIIYISTPWDLHTPMALYAMNHGKHVAIEVPAAKTLKECWDLVNTSERTRRHCIILENYCYRPFPLLTLNLKQQGFFGEIINADGSYTHDILRNITTKNFKWNMWRLKENMRIGDLYPTHGLGPVAQVLDINRGDKMDFIVSVASNDFTLGERVKELYAEDKDFYKPFVDKKYNGNICTSVIRTKKGKTIMLQHDVTSPNVFTDIYKIVGKKGSALQYPLPSRISHVDYHGGHEWLTDEEFNLLSEKYKPEIIKRVGKISTSEEGHGGSDILMNWRIIDCLRNGLPMDMDVYDAASWSSITELSAESINSGSNSVKIPDFTRGSWETNGPIDTSLKEGGNTQIKK